jgi:hypothetical protein
MSLPVRKRRKQVWRKQVCGGILNLTSNVLWKGKSFEPVPFEDMKMSKMGGADSHAA